MGRPSVERLDGLADEFNRLCVVTKIEIPDGEDVEILTCAGREGAQTKCRFDLSNPLVATTSVQCLLLLARSAGASRSKPKSEPNAIVVTPNRMPNATMTF